MTSALRGDVALLDVQMAGTDGLAGAAALPDELPTCRVLICSTFGRPGYLARAMASGAAGFIVKDAPPEQLADAVCRLHLSVGTVRNHLSAAIGKTGARTVLTRCASPKTAVGYRPCTARPCTQRCNPAANTGTGRTVIYGAAPS